jgi:UDP-N-acetyl-D-glucosamine dehydrogenase
VVLVVSGDKVGVVAVEELAERIASRRAVVAVVGQGFVGLPQAIEIGQAGFRVIGIDRDAERVRRLGEGRSPVPDVSDAQLAEAIASGAYRPTTEMAAAAEADVIIVCVPTPLNPDRSPDVSIVAEVANAVVPYVDRPRLIVLESTVPPGTTRSVVLPPLAAAGRVVGTDFFLGFAPERLDPGNQRYTMTTTPRLVSGITPSCLRLTEAFYARVVDEVKPVSSPEVAELAKAVENTFRFLNVGFANEVALLCDRLGYSVWEVIEAAATKPFAFMAHYPGPGVGGSCIPVVPQYLRHVAEQHDVPCRLIQSATEINDAMPGFIVEKLARLLRSRGVRLAEATILVVGVSYKPDVADLRESPALPILRLLDSTAARVAYHDPLVPVLELDGETHRSVPLDSEALGSADCVLLLTLHSSVDRAALLRQARFIFDTRNGLRAAGQASVAVL